MQASTALVDYVVAHELGHLLHRDHGNGFWRVLGKVMPDYETRRAVLARSGAMWQW